MHPNGPSPSQPNPATPHTCSDADLDSAYSYDPQGRVQSYGYGDAGPYHAVNRIGGADRFDYDANGNMTARNKGVAGSEQTLVWDAENRLSEVRDAHGSTLEQDDYDVNGMCVKKTRGATTTYTSFRATSRINPLPHSDRPKYGPRPIPFSISQRH